MRSDTTESCPRLSSLPIKPAGQSRHGCIPRSSWACRDPKGPQYKMTKLCCTSKNTLDYEIDTPGRKSGFRTAPARKPVNKSTDISPGAESKAAS